MMADVPLALGSRYQFGTAPAARVRHGHTRGLDCPSDELGAIGRLVGWWRTFTDEDVTMAQNQHLIDLEHAIDQLREQRRIWVKTLAAGAGHERGKTESAIESFLKCQTALEAIERAVDDERKANEDERKMPLEVARRPEPALKAP
jgi:hypothetical protein